MVQGAISGGAQGASLGGGLGRKLSGRSSRALADVKEGEKQARSKQHAEQGTGLNRVTAPIDSRNRRVGVRHADELARVNRANAAATAPSLAAGQKFQQSAEKFQQARGKMGTEGEWKQRGQSHDWMQQQADAFGISREKYMQSVGPFMSAAAEQGGRIDPDWEGGQMGNVDAAGNQVRVLSPDNQLQLPASTGTVASGQQVDPSSQRYLESVGGNDDDENLRESMNRQTKLPGQDEPPSGVQMEEVMRQLAALGAVQGQASAMNQLSPQEERFNVQPTLDQF